MSPSWFTMFFRDFVNPAEVFSDYAFAITSDTLPTEIKYMVDIL